MSKTRTVEIIAPTMTETMVTGAEQANKLRVAAYVRVSTELEEQESSFEAQTNYYTKYINDHPNWELSGIFADHGISGLNTKNRDSFNQMISLAMSGEIDLILTKSISRFARNTVDALSTIRKLKTKGVEVIFEKENLHSLDPTCEVMLTIMSSLAQEESRSISENVRWAARKRMQEGKFSLAYTNFLGYQKGADGRPEIVEEQAVIVREIYQAYLDGKSLNDIASELTKRKVPTPAGKQIWRVSTIRSILSNEKYKGDALLQKTYIPDYLTKKPKKNQGELPSVLVHNSHEAIIDSETFERVQELLNDADNKKRPRKQYLFTSRIVCGDCGKFYRHKFYKKRNGESYCLWFCNHNNEGGECQTPRLKEAEIIGLFEKLLKQLDFQDPSFTPERFKEMVDKVTIYRDGRAEFVLTDERIRSVRQ